MALKWIDLKRGEGVSSLEISPKRPGVLTVVGNLPHGIEIAPRSPKAARELIAWLECWIDDEEGR
jgi:hypothetical protein